MSRTSDHAADSPKRGFSPRINTDQHGLRLEDLTERIIGIFFDVYNELGHGFLESVYEEAMYRALFEAGLQAERQVPLTVWFRRKPLMKFKADLLVESAVLLELKAARGLDEAHEKKLLNYLRASDVEVGLLFNFGVKPQFKRLLFTNDRKIRVYPCLSVAENSEPQPPLQSEGARTPEEPSVAD